ncbi:MAG: phosphatase PAP2 family protein [Bacteroidaceae bacterium]|nr:phosphatase PAP2 family protein [Bacteroidaceae bacterium]
MAIDLFKREKLEVKFLAVEKLNILYNLLTTLLIIIFFDRLNDPQGMLMGRFVIAAGTFVVIYIYTKFPSKAMRLVRMVSQMFLLNYWYPDTFEFNRIFPNLDHWFATLEFDIFGCQPALLFEQVCSGIVWRELFNMGYWLYYPMIALVSFFCFFRRPKEVDRTTFIIMASFFLYYMVYIFLPVAGPQFYFPVIGDELAVAGPYPEIGSYFNLNPEITFAQEGKGALFTNLVGLAQSAGERPTAAFPSSHIGVSVVLLILSFKTSKRLAAILFPVFVLLCCATVYIKAHYLIDAIAGLVTGVVVYYIAAWLYGRFFEEKE